MAGQVPCVLATRQRSKSLSEIGVARRPGLPLAALEPAQEYTPPVDDPLGKTRCACGRLLPVFAPELQQKLDINAPVFVVRSFEHDETQVNAGAEEQDEDQVNADMQEEYKAQVDVDMSEQSSSSDEQDVKDDDHTAKDIQHWLNEARDNTEDSDTSSFYTCDEEMEDETSIQADHWSTAPPLPTPNNLTSTYLPFHSHRALSNHLSSARISHQLAKATPFFLHSTLQLPSILSHLLDIRLPSILRRLTPAVLLEHTTNVDPSTLLPAVVEVKMMSTYQHVQGLLFFSSFSTSTAVPLSIAEKIDGFYRAQTSCGMNKVDVEIDDSRGRRQRIAAWAWVSGENGVEERWSLEEFIGGQVSGLGGLKW